MALPGLSPEQSEAAQSSPGLRRQPYARTSGLGTASHMRADAALAPVVVPLALLYTIYMIYTHYKQTLSSKPAIIPVSSKQACVYLYLMRAYLYSGYGLHAPDALRRGQEDQVYRAGVATLNTEAVWGAQMRRKICRKMHRREMHCKISRLIFAAHLRARTLSSHPFS